MEGIEKDMKEYVKKLQALHTGRLSMQEWTSYCSSMFEDLVQQIEKKTYRKPFVLIEDEK